MHLNLEGRRVLIVGAGPVATRRCARLLEAGAEVVQVAPDRQAEATFGARHHRRCGGYDAEDLAGCHLVLACATPAVNAQVVADARHRNLWVACADDPTAGDFEVPAARSIGAVLLSLGTSGRAPSAAPVLLDRLAEQVPAAWARFVEALAEMRAQHPPGPARQRWLRSLARGPLLALLEAGDEAAARSECARHAPEGRRDRAASGSARAHGGGEP